MQFIDLVTVFLRFTQNNVQIVLYEFLNMLEEINLNRYKPKVCIVCEEKANFNVNQKNLGANSLKKTVQFIDLLSVFCVLLKVT